MRKIWFIRHGESQANAGEIVDDTRTVQLTRKGWDQAYDVARLIPSAPDLIVATPLMRTQQTALPARQRFPDAAYEIWPLQEFANLSRENYEGKTAAQRAPLVNAFWDRNDPYHIDGKGGESFADMVSRIKDGMTRLRMREEDFTVVFAHGWIMDTLPFLITRPDLPLQEMMPMVRGYHVANGIRNCEVIQANVDSAGLVLEPGERRRFERGLLASLMNRQGADAPSIGNF